jgi:hypothetical protein
MVVGCQCYTLSSAAQCAADYVHYVPAGMHLLAPGPSVVKPGSHALHSAVELPGL